MSYTIEEETGTFDREVHRHNGYYAGDFWGTSTEGSRSVGRRGVTEALRRLPAQLTR